MKANEFTKIGHYDTLEEFIDHFPLRLPTLLLSEPDPEQIDVDYWLDLFRRTKVGGVTFSFGGYVAYYHTQIPLHYKSRFLKEDQDLLGDLIRECRKMGMEYILARTDPHAVHQDVYDAHPDWIMRDAQGNPRRHWEHAEAWVTCALGPYNFEFMNEVNKEIFSRYEVNFLFSNRWAGSSICYCEHCQRNFRESCGMELPLEKDVHNPDYRSYVEWRQTRLFELASRWTSEIQTVKPGAFFIPNSGGGAVSEIDMVRLANTVPFLIVDRQGRPAKAASWINGKNAKEFRATLGRKPALAGVNVGVCGQYRWMDSTKSPAELRLWLAEAVANGMVPRYTKHSAVVYNDRWMPVVEDFFAWHARSEKYLRNVRPLANVALVYSQQTGTYYGGKEAEAKVEDHILGIYQALVEARIPFEMVHDRLLDGDHIGQFKTLILANTAALSDAQCDQLREFVRKGGSIVATLESSLYDEWGRKREDFGLSDLFGVSACGEVQGPMRNSYLNISPEANGQFHPLVKGLESAGRIINGIHRQPVKPNVDFPCKPVTFVPPYPSLPMEEIYPRPASTDTAEVYLRTFGQGRVVYFPWDVDRTFWELLEPDHGTLLRNAVLWASEEQMPVTVTGPGLLDVIPWEQKESLTVFLVNLTNPMTMRGAFRELIPLGEQTVTIRLPEGKQAARVRFLRSDISPIYENSGGKITLRVPSISDFELIAVDLI